MFQLNKNEWDALRSHFVTLNRGRGKYPKYLPYAFTEQGVAMLFGVLKSDIAIGVHIQIIRVFARIREMILSHKDILLQMEKKLGRHDEEIARIFQYLKQLLSPLSPPRNPIGFKRKNEK